MTQTQAPPTHHPRRITPWRVLTATALAASLAVAFTPTAQATGGIAPVPTPAGTVFALPAAGQSVTYQVPQPSRRTASTAEGARVFQPTMTVTVKAIPRPAAAPAVASGFRSSLVSRPSALLAPSGCYSMTAYYGFSLLWARMGQTWCFGSGLITYWPPADCWGSSTGPTYDYQGCSTSQRYGRGWNQGRTAWHANLCDAYVPLWGACVDHVYVNQEWYFAPSTYFFRL